MYPKVFSVENGFDFVLSNRTGTPLNDLTTNRQRFMVDNSQQWQSVLAARKLVVEAAEEDKERKRLQKETIDAARNQKVRCCSNLCCISTIDITTFAIQKINEQKWKKCKGKRCSVWVCPDHFADVSLHEIKCSKYTAL